MALHPRSAPKRARNVVGITRFDLRREAERARQAAALRAVHGVRRRLFS
ncbi:hypothetical protein [Jiangella anatolica]|nr:hypothetical protein [Jiangella anatolica]